MKKHEESTVQLPSLGNLPEGFDRSVINWSNSMRHIDVFPVAKADWDPMERNHFKGWYAIPNSKVCKLYTREHIAARIIKTGGECTLKKGGSSPSFRRIRILDAYVDGNYVVIHIQEAD